MTTDPPLPPLLPPSPPLSGSELGRDDRDNWLVGEGTSPWRRLHPLSPIVRAGRGLVPLFVVVLIDLLARHGIEYDRLIGDAVVVVVLLVLGVVSWLVTRWRVENGVLHIETGLVRRRSLRYPLSQVQSIDLVETGFARAFGLAELRLRMAGGADRGGGRLQGLKHNDALTVRAELLAVGVRLAHADTVHAVAPGDSTGSPPHPEVAEHPVLPTADRVLFMVPSDRLVGSVVLSGGGLLACMAIGGMFVLLFLSPAAAGAVLSSTAVAVFGLGTVLYRRLNGEYRQTVSLAPDGFRLTSGLVEKTSETIPFGRVQGIRLVEPLLWRPVGWFRLEVEVAGKRVREENSSQGRQRRALLPVGPRAAVEELLRELVPGAPLLAYRPPRRARWKAPLSYRNLGWGVNDECVVTRSGRLRRTTHWVRLEKVQSIRRVQGPVQRRFGVGSVHVDSAGRSIHALIRDEEFAVANQQVATLPSLCRAARERVRSGGTPGDARRGRQGVDAS